MQYSVSFPRPAFRLCVCALFALSAFSAFAQNTIQEDGNTIEFVGLREWTIQRLADSVRKHDPRGKLGFCAATLKSDLGFCDASVIMYPKSDTSRNYDIVISVVEPQDSALVRRNVTFAEALFLPREWDDMAQKYHSYRYNYEKSLAHRTRFLPDDSAKTILQDYAKRLGRVKLDTGAFYDIRQTFQTAPVHIANLSRIVRSSFNPYARGFALYALAGVPDNDTAFAAIVHALLDIGASTAIVPADDCLDFALKHRKTPVHLAPLSADLRRLVNGANLFAYSSILKLIAAGKPTEKDFREIFASEQSRRLLFAYLRAATSGARISVENLMNALKPNFTALTERDQKAYLKIQ